MNQSTYETYCEMEIKYGIKKEYDFGRDAILTVFNNGVCFVSNPSTGTLKMYTNYQAAALAARIIKANNKSY